MIGASPEDSLGQADEPELIRYLLRDWHWGEPVLRAVGISPGAVSKLEVMLTDFGRDDDLDLLSARAEKLNEATAVQFKLAKVSAATYYTLMPNKLAELPKLFRQTNPLIELGFHRVVACLVVLIDARATPDGQLVFGGLTETLGPEINTRIKLEGLHAAAGFVRIDFVQDAGAAPLTNGEINCSILRPATRRQQTTRITEWVENVLKCGLTPRSS